MLNIWQLVSAKFFGITRNRSSPSLPPKPEKVRGAGWGRLEQRCSLGCGKR